MELFRLLALESVGEYLYRSMGRLRNIYYIVAYCEDYKSKLNCSSKEHPSEAF